MIHQSSHNGQPTVGDFLDDHPLPPDIAHMGPILGRFPNPLAIIDIVLGCSAAGLGKAQFERVLTEAANLFDAPAQRCACCLSWNKFFHVVATIIDDDDVAVAAVCDRCKRKVESGAATQRMMRNLHSYAIGGAK